MLDVPAKPALFFSVPLSLAQKSKENEREFVFIWFSYKSHYDYYATT